MRTRMATRDARYALVHSLMASPSARSLALMSKSARFNGRIPPPRTHPVGADLDTSVSGIEELATPVSRGRGTEAAFARRRRVGVPTSRARPVAATPLVGGTGGSAGYLPGALPEGGGGTMTSGVAVT